MRFSKFDIGAEIIAILTRGMYPDPKDALREYIQNGVDAKASHIDVKIRQNNIIVHDNGYGMNYATLRKAARIGVSDKNPSKDVGFMGIGIYSAYHLCNSLTIISKKEGELPNRLVMRFSEMKSALKEQRELRQSGSIDSDKAIDLQTLLESFVDITDDGEMANELFPNVGTRVELSGVSEYFYSEISNIDVTAKYLQEVVPLKFDSGKFKYANEIEAEIKSACEKNDSVYESIDLTLQVNSEHRRLFKPYQDSDFHNDIAENMYLYPIKANSVFYGVMWGCLNSERKKIKNLDLRGFLIKKQGFAIGKRSDVVKHFPRGNTFFDRYIGEVIITNPQLLPNASRNDIEYSPIRERFFSALTELAGQFDDVANTYQENCKADAVLDQLIADTKEISMRTQMSLQNSDELLILYTRLSYCNKDLAQRIKTKRIRPERIQEAKALDKEIGGLLTFIKDRLAANSEKQKADAASAKKDNGRKKSKKWTAPDFSRFEVASSSQDEIKYDTLLALVDDLEFKYDDNIRVLLDLIDERFIQAVANNKEDYYNLLTNLKREFLDED